MDSALAQARDAADHCARRDTVFGGYAGVEFDNVLRYAVAARNPVVGDRADPVGTRDATERIVPRALTKTMSSGINVFFIQNWVGPSASKTSTMRTCAGNTATSISPRSRNASEAPMRHVRWARVHHENWEAGH
ncbi:MAG: hypothetical protein ACYDB9_09660 [Gammaproteobacteria bacterium]